MTPSQGWHFAFAGRKLLLEETESGLTLPSGQALTAALPPLTAAPVRADVSLPPLPDGPCHAYDLPADIPLPAGFQALGLRSAHGHLSEELFVVAGTALQKVEWLRSHGFCSRCGHATERHANHEALACTSCGRLHFPRLAPAVIVLIERDREMLLARSPTFPEGVYSTVAGFVEPGESLEQAVHREIREEVGVEVEDVRYFGSQPWPFPHSLMIGFVARWAGGDIRIDGDEIEHARWFSADDLPKLPSSMSIARRLVDDFLARTS